MGRGSYPETIYPPGRRPSGVAPCVPWSWTRSPAVRCPGAVCRAGRRTGRDTWRGWRVGRRPSYSRWDSSDCYRAGWLSWVTSIRCYSPPSSQSPGTARSHHSPRLQEGKVIVSNKTVIIKITVPVLSNIAPADIRKEVPTSRTIIRARGKPELPLPTDIDFHHNHDENRDVRYGLTSRMRHWPSNTSDVHGGRTESSMTQISPWYGPTPVANGAW